MPPTAAGLRLAVLGSGSGGNSTLVEHGRRAMLIDAGFGPRTTPRRLQTMGVAFDQVEAICLTHLDQDHFRPTWPPTLLKRGMRVFLHHQRLPAMLKMPGGRDLHHAGLLEVFDEKVEPLPGLIGTTLCLAHDKKGTIGFRFEAAGRVFGYATDLGHVPAALIDLFSGVALLCLECNYDEQMTLASPRPAYVNRRNMSDAGHLSNEQAFDAVCAIDAASSEEVLRDVVLLHRSRQCNDRRKIQQVFAQAPHLWRRVTLTEQRGCTRWLSVGRAPAPMAGACMQ